MMTDVPHKVWGQRWREQSSEATERVVFLCAVSWKSATVTATQKWHFLQRQHPWASCFLEKQDLMCATLHVLGSLSESLQSSQWFHVFKFLFDFLWKRVSCSLGWALIGHVAKDDPKLLSLLTPSPMCWDYRCYSLCLAFSFVLTVNKN